jgi:hypothetical protein
MRTNASDYALVNTSIGAGIVNITIRLSVPVSPVVVGGEGRPVDHPAAGSPTRDSHITDLNTGRREMKAHSVEDAPGESPSHQNRKDLTSDSYLILTAADASTSRDWIAFWYEPHVQLWPKPIDPTSRLNPSPQDAGDNQTRNGNSK